MSAIPAAVPVSPEAWTSKVAPYSSIYDRLDCPLLGEVKRWDTSVIDTDVLQWLTQYGIVSGVRASETLLRIQPGKLAAYTFGYCTAERLTWCARAIGWFFSFDDRYPDGAMRFDPDGLARVHERFSSILDLEPSEPSEPFAVAFRELYAGLVNLAPDHWVRRFTRSSRAYFWGCERETWFRKTRRVPTVAQYLAYRPCSFGIYQMLDMIEFAQAEFLPDKVALSPWLEEARVHAGVLLSIDGDMYSAGKEAGEEEGNNLISILSRHEGVSPEVALRRSVEVHQEIMQDYLRAEARLRDAPQAGVPRFLQGLRVWFDGNRRWSAECPRYNQLARSTKDESGRS